MASAIPYTYAVEDKQHDVVSVNGFSEKSFKGRYIEFAIP
jgi:hypothetical protein